MSIHPEGGTVTPTPHDAARSYAAKGWRVVPIAPGTKHPAGLAQWQKAATTDTDIIDAWWTGLYHKHGVGIATGPLSGLWVLDIDTHGNDGTATLRALMGEHGQLPATPIAITGSGGYHILFRWDPERPIRNTQGGYMPLGPGIDIRGEGGQIVAAPSIHPNGQPYRWRPGSGPDTPVADAPEWIYTLLAKADEERVSKNIEGLSTSSKPPTLNLISTSSSNGSSSDDSIAEWARTQHHFPDLLTADGWTHMGGDRWCRPGKHPRDGHSAILHDDQVLVVWSTEAADLYQHGKPTIDGSGVSVSLFGYLAATRHGGDRSEAARALREERTHQERTHPPVAVADGPTAPAVHLNRHTEALLTEQALNNLQPPQPIAHGWLYRNSLAVLYGPPKKGKTFVAVDLAMAIATGTPWLGGQVEAGTVVYTLGEGVAGLPRRINAWRQDRQVDSPARLVVLPHAVQLANRLDVTDFLEAVGPYDPDLIVIDTLARASVGVEENSSKEMGELIAQADRIKEQTGACVLLVHHTGKDAARGTRGSSALTGAVDTGIEVRGDTKAMTLVNTEQKDAEPADALQFRAKTVGESMVFAPAVDLGHASETVIAVMEALVEIDTGGVAYTAWMDQAAERGVHERTFRRSQKWLVDNRQVVNVGSQKRPLWTVNSPDLDVTDGEF